MKPSIRAVIPLIVLAGATPVLAQDFEDAPTLVAFQPTTEHVFAARGTTIMEWDARSGAALRTINWPGRTIQVLTCTQDGSRLVGTDDKGKVVVWDLAQGKVTRTFETAADGGTVTALDVSSDGRVLAITDPLHVKLFDLTSGRSFRSIKLENSNPSDVKFAPDGKTLVVLSPGMLFYDATGQPLAEFASDTKESPGRRGFDAAAWTPDSQRVVGAGGHVVIANAKGPHVIGDVDHGLGSNNHHVVVTADGKWLGMSIDGGPGGTGGLAWFTLPSLTYKATWKLDRVLSMAISRDGKLVAVAQPNSVVKILDATADKISVLRTLTIAAPAATAAAPVADASGAPAKPAPATAPLPAGSDKLLARLAYAAAVIQRENDRVEASRVEDDAKECADAVAALLAAKVPETVEVSIDTPKVAIPGTRPDPQHGGVFLTIAGVRDHICHDGQTRFTITAVSLAAGAAAVWVGKIQHKDEQASGSLLEYATKTGEECRGAVRTAKAANIPRTTMIDFPTYTSDLKSPLSLADIDDKVCMAAIALSKTALAQEAAAEKAAYAPYLKVLSGDKAKMFWEKRMLGGENWYGHGGRRLTKPSDFASSDVWYYYVVDRNGIVPAWEVEGWTFAGVKNTGVYTKSGSGDTPPSSAYR
jgi:hypothetical protein